MLGLGSTRTFTLKEARERARAARQKLADNIDPVDAKRAAKTATAVASAKALTFAQAADRFFDQYAAEWTNDVHRAQFRNSMKNYVTPIIGHLPVAAIDTALVIKVLEQPVDNGRFWDVRRATASRVRNRIERVLAWATVRGFRSGDNPAAWRGHLKEAGLPSGRATKKFAAMAYTDVPAFIGELGETVAAKALKFLILTATRTAETIGARWAEINFETATWTIPKDRMKTRREHAVPLSEPAIELLRSMYTEDGNPFIFPGYKPGAGLSEGVMAITLKRINPDPTVHGFRSSFRTWAAEQTNYPREVAEQSLAHTVGNAVERSYQRSSLFDHRRRLMAEWATYCCSPPSAGEVVALRVVR